MSRHSWCWPLCAGLIGCGVVQSAPDLAHPARIAPRPAAHFASPYAYEWFVRAELARADRDWDVALEAYRSALSGADDDAELLARYGSALAEAGQETRAGQVLAQALALDPDNEAVSLARADWQLRRGDLDGAYTDLERAEYAAPLSARAPLQLAELLRAHGHGERALAVLARYRQRALASAQGSADAYQVELASALTRADPDAIFDATLPYRLGTPPRSAAALNRAASLLLAASRPALAGRVLALLPAAERSARTELGSLLAAGSTGALELWLATHESDDFEVRMLAARAALRLGKLDDAQAILAAESVSQPGLPILQLLAAEIALARAHYAQAATLFASVPLAAPESAEAKWGLGHALDALGLSTWVVELTQ